MKAHRTDVVSFAFGLIFLGLAAWWLLAQLLGLALPPVGWFLAGGLLLIGLLGLLGALRSGRSTGPNPPGDADTPGPESTDPAGPDAPDATGPGSTDPTGPDVGSDWAVAAPFSGAPAPGGYGGPEPVDRTDADEWPTDAVTDVSLDAVEDRTAIEDRWSEESLSAPDRDDLWPDEPPTTTGEASPSDGSPTAVPSDEDRRPDSPAAAAGGDRRTEEFPAATTADGPGGTDRPRG